MGRLKDEMLERVERYADRVLDVTEVLEKSRRPRRVVDQMTESGTSVGANSFEADEAMSAKDFIKCLGVILKELNETRFWLRRCVSRKWIPQHRLDPLLEETRQLRAIFGTMVVRTRNSTVRRKD